MNLDLELGPVWVINNSIKCYGGGICIDDRGIIFTCASWIGPGDVARHYVLGRFMKGEFRKLKFCQLNKSLDLALLMVEDTRKNEKFAYIKLEGCLDLGRGDLVKAITHLGGTPYSSKQGNICFPYPTNAPTTPFYQNDTVSSRSTGIKIGKGKTDKERVLFESRRWRTVGCIVDANESTNDLVYICQTLFADLPLIQVYCLGCDWDFSCIGSPVFCLKKDKHILIGIISFFKGHFEYVIPSPIMHSFFESVNPLDGMGKPLSAKGRKRKIDDDAPLNRKKRGGRVQVSESKNSRNKGQEKNHPYDFQMVNIRGATSACAENSETKAVNFSQLRKDGSLVISSDKSSMVQSNRSMSTPRTESIDFDAESRLSESLGRINLAVLSPVARLERGTPEDFSRQENPMVS